MLYLGFLLLAGILQGVMVSLNAQMGNYFSLFGICFFVHGIALVLLLVFVLKNGKELTWGYISAVPWWVYLGSICGLLAQLLQIIGTLHSNTLVSSVLMLVGNLGMSLTLDYVFYGTFSLLRAAGILLILLGMTWVEKEKHAPAEDAE